MYSVKIIGGQGPQIYVTGHYGRTEWKTKPSAVRAARKWLEAGNKCSKLRLVAHGEPRSILYYKSKTRSLRDDYIKQCDKTLAILEKANDK